MTPEQAVLDRVMALSPVTALVSTRVYLDQLPSSPVFPCVRVVQIDDPQSYHLRGPSGIGQARIQVDAYGKQSGGYDAAVALADAIRGDGKGPDASGLSGWIGTVGSPAFEVLACHRLDRRRTFDPDERQVLTISQDYRVTYRAAA